MKKKNVFQLDPSAVHVRLGMCAAALTGTAAAVPSAQADIITFNTPIAVPNTVAGVYINLGTGANGAPKSAVPGWDFNPYSAASQTQLGFYWNLTNAGSSTTGGVATTTLGPYRDLPPGEVVSGASTFSTTILGTTGSPYLTTGTHILGFRLFNETTSAVNYGYLTMTTTATNGFPATVQSWSYDNTGAPITVVPEPSTTALLTIAALVAGAIGLREWRRQRAAN